MLAKASTPSSLQRAGQSVDSRLMLAKPVPFERPKNDLCGAETINPVQHAVQYPEVA